MKRLFLAFAMTPVLTATPSLADYKTCMDYCMTKHDFDHCQPICSDQAKSSSAETSTARKPVKPCMSTNEEKEDQIFDFLQKHYGPTSLFAYTSHEDPNLFEIDFFPYYPEKRKCTGVVRIHSDCSTVTDTNGNDLANERLRQQTLLCED